MSERRVINSYFHYYFTSEPREALRDRARFTYHHAYFIRPVALIPFFPPSSFYVVIIPPSQLDGGNLGASQLAGKVEEHQEASA